MSFADAGIWVWPCYWSTLGKPRLAARCLSSTTICIWVPTMGVNGRRACAILHFDHAIPAMYIFHCSDGIARGTSYQPNSFDRNTITVQFGVIPPHALSSDQQNKRRGRSHAKRTILFLIASFGGLEHTKPAHGGASASSGGSARSCRHYRFVESHPRVCS